MNSFYNVLMNFWKRRHFGGMGFQCRDKNPLGFIKKIIIRVLKMSKNAADITMQCAWSNQAHCIVGYSTPH